MGCLKPLNSWVTDFIQRIEFMSSWLTNGSPKSFWVPSLFFPQGFMTASMQMHARKHKIAIDTLEFQTNVSDTQDPAHCIIPDNFVGVFIHGLFLQGCGWDLEGRLMRESEKSVLFLLMPLIHLEPVDLTKKRPPDDYYTCPLYKTSTRAGTLSTTGPSTNFVMYLQLLHAGKGQDHWVRRGCAMLCMLDD